MKHFTLFLLMFVPLSLIADEWQPVFKISGDHGSWSHSRGSLNLKSEGFIQDKGSKPRVYLEIICKDGLGPSYESVTIINQIINPLAKALSDGERFENSEEFSVKADNQNVDIRIRKSKGSYVGVSMSLPDAKVLGQRLLRLSKLLVRMADSAVDFAEPPPAPGSVPNNRH